MFYNLIVTLEELNFEHHSMADRKKEEIVLQLLLPIIETKTEKPDKM